MFDTKIIGEIGSNHMGNFETGTKLIDMCKKIGCSLIKMQLWKADDLYNGTPIYKTAKKLELNFDLAKAFFNYAKNINIDLFFSIFYPEAIDFCEKIDIKYYKIASRTVNDKKILQKVADTGKPVFISFSREYLCDKSEIKKIFKFNDLISFYTISRYPPKLNDFSIYDLEKIIVNGGGYSNHYKNIYACQLAMFLGASWIESHVMFDRYVTSPDDVCSLTIRQLKELINWQNKMRLLWCNKC